MTQYELMNKLLNGLISLRNTLRSLGESWGFTTPTDTMAEVVDKFSAIPNNGAVQLQVKENETIPIPDGLHKGGTVTGIEGGATINLQQRSVTPSKSEQNITPAEGYIGLSGVKVYPIPAQYQDVSNTTAQAEGVLQGDLFTNAQGQVIAGTMPNRGAMELTLDGLLEDYIEIPEGYHNGTRVYLGDSIAKALAEI